MLIAAGLGLSVLLAALPAAGEEPRYGPRAWQDPVSGLAIGGYDPLTYFTHAKPLRGRSKYEHVWGGAVWQFVNSGNRDAFKRDPAVYAPAFAGYDPYSLSLGRTTPGEPTIWARYRNRIYFFSSGVHLRLWREGPEQVIEKAGKQWAVLSRTLPSSLGY